MAMAVFEEKHKKEERICRSIKDLPGSAKNCEKKHLTISNEPLDYEPGYEKQLIFEFFDNLSLQMKQKRKKLGWTQKHLAEISGVNRITIVKLESCKRTASFEMVLKLLDVLNMQLGIVDK